MSNLSNISNNIPKKIMQQQEDIVQNTEVQKLLNHVLDKLHDTLRFIPDESNNSPSELRKEVLLGMYHISLAVELINKQSRFEQDSRNILDDSLSPKYDNLDLDYLMEVEED